MYSGFLGPTLVVAVPLGPGCVAPTARVDDVAGVEGAVVCAPGEPASDVAVGDTLASVPVEPGGAVGGGADGGELLSVDAAGVALGIGATFAPGSFAPGSSAPGVGASSPLASIIMMAATPMAPAATNARVWRETNPRSPPVCAGG